MHGPIRLNFELGPDFMLVLPTCKNKNNSIKNEGARVFTTILPFKFMGMFSDAQGQLTPHPQSLVETG